MQLLYSSDILALVDKSASQIMTFGSYREMALNAAHHLSPEDVLSLVAMWRSAFRTRPDALAQLIHLTGEITAECVGLRLDGALTKGA
jgi:hypothetical protein